MARQSRATETTDQDLRPPPRRGSAVKAWFIAIVAIGGCGALAYHNWMLYQQNRGQRQAFADTQAANDECTAQLEPALVRAQSCESARAEEAEHTEALSEAQKQMEADLHATATELASLRKLKVEADARADQFDDLKRQLQSMIDTGQLELQRLDGRLVVRLPAEVLFRSGSADLSEEGKVALIKLSAVLENVPDRKFMIAGHTDSLFPAKGSKFKTNWELSTARAVNVTQLLVTAKIDPKNLVAAGYGEFAPIGDNDTESGREQNRRIEIVLLPNLDELAVFDQDKG